MRPRHLATMVGLSLLLSGCAGSGFDGFVNNTFSMHGDHHRPGGSAENLARANGGGAPVTPIVTAPGNVWPGPIKPLPSLADIAKSMPQGETVPNLPPLPGGSGIERTPPATLGLPAMPPSTSSPGPSEKPGVPVGTVVPTTKGPEKVSGGTGNFLTLTGPKGQYSGIMVPNGNGTSTIIRPGGGVETVPTPR